MKTKTIFICQNCGAQSPRWVGKCAACQSWNSYAEEAVANSSPNIRREDVPADKPVLLADVVSEARARMITGIVEFDRVMGGGIIPGGVTLIGGDPGIGKSTLTLQVVKHLAQQGQRVLYVSGEESVQQTKLRAQRLEAAGPETGDRKTSAKQDGLYIVNQVDLEVIKNYILELKPDVVVIDSIQVVFHPEVTSSPGSVTQVRECAAILTHLVKARGIALFLIGHVTKEGMIAGPRVLEHIVDTVLYFEGERYTAYRLLRSIKNRFGSTNELGVFEMTGTGLKEVENPSQIFLSERPVDATGSVVTSLLEGSRPLLVEVQGLVSRSSFGVVRQKAQGFDANRLALLVAVLEKRLGLNLQDKDIFLNVVGGVKVMDPAADLAVIMAIASAFLDRSLAAETIVLGEVGLSAEIRSVSQLNLRLNEAQKLGFKCAIVPRHNLKVHGLEKAGLKLIPVENVKEALARLTE